MKVLLVHPSCLMYSELYLRLEPLGMERVAEAARSAGHDVRILDLQVFRHEDYFRELREFQPRAVGAVKEALVRGWWVVDGDLQGDVDPLDHDLLLALVRRRISNRRVLKLLRQWRKAGVLEEGAWSPTAVGSPQGGG